MVLHEQRINSATRKEYYGYTGSTLLGNAVRGNRFWIFYLREKTERLCPARYRIALMRLSVFYHQYIPDAFSRFHSDGCSIFFQRMSRQQVVSPAHENNYFIPAEYYAANNA